MMPAAPGRRNVVGPLSVIGEHPFMPQGPIHPVRQFYRALHAAYGPQGWWPGRTAVEIVVGAILTQNTNWRNVERAIDRLRAAGMLSWRALRDVGPGRLARLIRPSGYYTVKARRLKHFVDWLWNKHGGDFASLRSRPLRPLRDELLGINGIGPETADSILLYALDRPSFVVDAYTQRVVRRHRLAGPDSTYAQTQTLFTRGLPRSVRLYNEYHALLVAVGKRHCRPQARCEGCPLEPFPHDARS
jgi:endonuclease-3 related protein